jgi:predicted transcriptional regulator of viral defense system
MRSKFATTASIAGRQHGRVAWRQLVEAGVDRNTTQRWLRDGRLRPVHHGSYALGHGAPSTDGDWMAAVLACGTGAVLSHRAAAHRMRLLAGAPPRPQVTVPTTAHRRRPGIVIHRVRALHPLDVSVLDGIPITTVPRVLLDLAPSTTTEELTRMCHEAWVRHHTTPAQIEACIARNPGKKGAPKLRRALHCDATLSALETVELLSYRFHATRHAFEQDVARRRRSNHVAYSWGDVFERGDATVADLRERQATCGGTPGPCAGP